MTFLKTSGNFLDQLRFLSRLTGISSSGTFLDIQKKNVKCIKKTFLRLRKLSCDIRQYYTQKFANFC